MHDAGLVGSEFRLDPVAVLEETDPLKRAIRLAAFMAVQADRAAAYKRAGSK